jgi:transposase
MVVVVAIRQKKTALIVNCTPKVGHPSNDLGCFFMSKYSAQFKRSVVKDYLSDERVGSGEVARRRGVDEAAVRKWVAAWRLHGNEAFRKKYSRYDARFKLKVLQFMQMKALSCRQTAAVFDVRNPAMIGIWKRQYDSQGIQALQPRPRARTVKQSKSPPAPDVSKPDKARTKEELLEELNFLRMENAYLKKLDALIRSESPTAQRKKRK